MTRTSKMKFDICSVIVQSFRPEILSTLQNTGAEFGRLKKIN